MPSIYEVGFSGNYPRIEARKMLLQPSPFMFYRHWMKFNTPKGKVDPNGAQLMPQTPIVVHQELKKEGGNQLVLPMMRSLDNLPKTGKAQLSGHEEEIKLNHMDLFVDLERHAVKTKEGSLSKLTLEKQYQLTKRYKPALWQHYAQVGNFMQIPSALYKGQAWNVFDAGNVNGLVPKSHPNVFVAGYGKVSYASGYPTTSGYETEIGTQIGALGSTHIFDTELLMALKTDPKIVLIPPLLTKDGNEYRIIIANSKQLYDLKMDTNFKDAMFATMAQNYAKENPYLVGCKYYYDGWAIFDGGDVVWPVSVDGGVPVWGPPAASKISSFRNYTGDVYAAQILGDNALGKGTGTSMEFIGESRDYDEIDGVGYRIIEGYARNDYDNKDDGTQGQYLLNDSSAVVVTKVSTPVW